MSTSICCATQEKRTQEYYRNSTLNPVERCGKHSKVVAPYPAFEWSTVIGLFLHRCAIRVPCQNPAHPGSPCRVTVIDLPRYFNGTPSLEIPALFSPLVRHGSVADLRGFHTPHGGSVTDLCELSVLAESSVYEGMGQTQLQRLLAAPAPSTTTPSSLEAVVSAQPDTTRVNSTPTNAASDYTEGYSNDSAVRESGLTAAAVSKDSAAAALHELPASVAAVSNNGVMLKRNVYAEEGRIAAARLSSTMPRATTGTRALQAAPVMSLSGHLIGPELRRGEGGDEAHKCARRAFISEAVTWHHFSRHSQVCFVCVCDFVFFLVTRYRSPRSLNAQRDNIPIWCALPWPDHGLSLCAPCLFPLASAGDLARPPPAGGNRRWSAYLVRSVAALRGSVRLRAAFAPGTVVPPRSSPDSCRRLWQFT